MVSISERNQLGGTYHDDGADPYSSHVYETLSQITAAGAELLGINVAAGVVKGELVLMTRPLTENEYGRLEKVLKPFGPVRIDCEAFEPRNSSRLVL